MDNSIRPKIVHTSHGEIAVEEIGCGDPPVVLIHGNSFCRGVFRRQMHGTLAGQRRLIAFDLPGHGQSSDAPDPARTYTRSGLADATVELLGALGATQAVVFGWSLGGHIGIEMMHRLPEMLGLMIAGTPAVGRAGMAQGFVHAPGFGLAGQEVLSEAECAAFVESIFGTPAEPSLVRAVARADGRFRKRLFEAARAGDGVDQRNAVETNSIPLAVVNGAADRIVNLDYIEGLDYANLWHGKCHRLPGVGHAAFWEAPERFNLLLDRFVADVVQ